MTTKHTPGPWKCGQYLGQLSWFVHMDVGDRGRGMEIVEGVAGLTDEQRLANARLIAAAPDLLEALQHLLVAHGEQLDYAFQQAQEAIAKATGETK